MGKADVDTGVLSRAAAHADPEGVLETLAEDYFSIVLTTSLNTLLAPIVSRPLAGELLIGSELYQVIRHAREEDDPSLPLGPWERELKRAEWPSVSKHCVNGLATRSKDLQLATWLLEAEIARHGFRAIAPCLYLISQLCEHYWDHVFPLDAEYRDNLFRWINEKLLSPLRLVPFTETGAVREFGWADWEQAQHNEQVRAALGSKGEAQIEGTTLNQFTGALSSSPSPSLAQNHEHLRDALAALDMLDGLLDAQLGRDAPSFGSLHSLIENIFLMLGSELRKRGYSPPPRQLAVPDMTSTPNDSPAAASATESKAVTAQPLRDGDRASVYAALANIANTLARLEPHSPVPYLIRRAVDWGQLNTAELYQEVFVRCEGHISIFELLGLARSEGATDAQA
ncbi:MAG: hypothetical protein JWN23_2959 [Rhodocyclales bacterium]|nr:hypothetical protein [Rhodocyclales bacterium]